MVEAGYPDLIIGNWFGLIARKNTPPDLVDALSKAAAKVVAMPKVKESLTKLGAEPLGTSPAAFTKLIASEIDRWTALAEKYHIRMN